MIKNYVDLKGNEKLERKIKITCDFHSAYAWLLNNANKFKDVFLKYLNK